MRNKLILQAMCFVMINDIDTAVLLASVIKIYRHGKYMKTLAYNNNCKVQQISESDIFRCLNIEQYNGKCTYLKRATQSMVFLCNHPNRHEFQQG
jgi:hypothetical protein